MQFGNLTTATDASGNVTTATYDVRGGKIVDTDPDMGSWTYAYITLGLPVSQMDAKGQTVSLTYDKLDRIIQRVEPDKTSTWNYDTAAHGVGKLASSGIAAGSGAGYSRSSTFDALCRPNQVTTTIDSSTYVMGAIYDANSRLSKVNYPSGFTARYAYTGLGDVSQLLDDATNQVHWTANAMDAELRLTQQAAGNGLVTTSGYDVLTGRLTTIATGSGSAVQNLSLTYDQRGNPLSRSDANTNLSETFSYDALNRLTTSTVNPTQAPLSKTFSYDPVGNLLSKSDVGTYTYPAAGQPQPNAVTSISAGSISTTFTYDLNGNQTSGLGRTIDWTSYNKPASITQGARTISFVDDTKHQRFKQVTPEETRLYLSAFGVAAEVTNPGTSSQIWTDYLSVGDPIVGMRTIQTASEMVTTRYFHPDHLGSISVITNEAGAVVERLSYDAWGKRRNPNGTDDTAGSITSQSSRGFTGEEQLSVAGLVHLNGRVYDPILARMTSADPIVPRPLSTQGWNRYAYVSNSPLTFVDSSGYVGEYPSNGAYPVPPVQAYPLPPVQQQHWVTCSCGGMVYPAPLPAPTVFPQFDTLGNIAALGASVSSGIQAANAAAWAQATTPILPVVPVGSLVPAPSVPISGAGEYPSGPAAAAPTAPPSMLDRALRAIEPGGMLGAGPGGGLGWLPGAPQIRAVEGGLSAVLGAASAYGRVSRTLSGATAGARVNMPAWKRIVIDMEEVASGHMVGGRRLAPGNKKDLFPESMTPTQVERAIRNAYRNGEVLSSQGDRVFVRGPFGSGSIEMWVNKASKAIETAWPKF